MNKAINTATNQLGALRNLLLNGNGRGGKKNKGKGGRPSLPEPLEKALVNRTELVIDHLSDARQTSLDH